MNTRWSKVDEILLAEVWVEVNQHTHAYNDHLFWNKVVDMFNDQTVGDNRNINMVRGKWTRINLDCIQFNIIFYKLQRTSGEYFQSVAAYNDRLNDSKTIFEQRSIGRRSFQYVHVWEVLRNHPIWLIYG